MTTNLSLIFPMFAMVILTAVVLIVSFRARVQAVRNQQIKISYFRTFSDGQPPEQVLKTTRHFSNLFEVPTLFYAACITGMVIPVLSELFLICAWLYVVARLFHAYIHIGANRIRPRMIAYALSWTVLLVMWIQIAATAMRAMQSVS